MESQKMENCPAKSGIPGTCNYIFPQPGPLTALKSTIIEKASSKVRQKFRRLLLNT